MIHMSSKSIESKPFNQIVVNTYFFFSYKLIFWRSYLILILVSIFVSILFIYMFRSVSKEDLLRRMKIPIHHISNEELSNTCSRIMKKARTKNSTVEDQILIPEPVTALWRKDEPYHKSILMQKYTGKLPVMGKGRDEQCMNAYLKNVQISGFQDPKLDTLSNLLPAGAPIIDFLSVTMQQSDDWKLPNRGELEEFRKNRSLSVDMLNQVEVKEIVVGVTSEEKTEEILNWFWGKYYEDQSTFPTNSISMDVEQHQSTLYETYRLAGRLKFKPGSLMTTKLEETIEGEPDDRPQQIPVKLMLGNGITYALMVSLDISQDAKGRYLVNRIIIPDSILNFITMIPVCTGVGIKHDVADIEYFYSLFSNEKIEMKGFVELGTLASVAGYRMESKCMTTMAIQVLGMTMNKMVSTADGKWASRWSEIPKSLKVYALGDLKMGHLTYYTLAAVILRDYLPDPDIVLQYFDTFSQWDPANWFLKLLMSSLEGSEIHEKDMKLANSRSEMINSIRYRMGEDTPLADEPARKIKMWADMKGNWPSITRGGCRFVHQSRAWFLQIVKIWNKEKLKDESGERLKPASEDLEKYARFGISSNLIQSTNFSEPCGQLGLTAPGSLSHKVLNMNPETVKSFKIGRFCTKQARIQRLIVLEWARLNPNLISEFLRRMGADVQFQKFYRHLYDPLRHLFRRLFAQEAITVVFMEGVLIKNLKAKYEEEFQAYQNVVKEERVRARRLVYLKKVIESGDDKERARWVEDIPALPRWVITRHKKKENGVKRKAEKEMNSAVKKTRSDEEKEVPVVSDNVVGLVGAESDQGVQQPGEDAENEVIMIDAELSNAGEVAHDESDPDESDLEDARNVLLRDPTPEKEESRRVRLVSPDPRTEHDEGQVQSTAQDEMETRRIHSVRTIPLRRKKKGKKKSSTPKLSYDEMIESKVQQFSDSEFTLETQWHDQLDFE